jgi:hypothetical protein
MESKSGSGAAIGMVMSRGEHVPGEERLKSAYRGALSEGANSNSVLLFYARESE